MIMAYWCCHSPMLHVLHIFWKIIWPRSFILNWVQTSFELKIIKRSLQCKTFTIINLHIIFNEKWLVTILVHAGNFKWPLGVIHVFWNCTGRKGHKFKCGPPEDKLFCSAYLCLQRVFLDRRAVGSQWERLTTNKRPWFLIIATD